MKLFGVDINITIEKLVLSNPRAVAVLVGLLVGTGLMAFGSIWLQVAGFLIDCMSMYVALPKDLQRSTWKQVRVWLNDVWYGR